MKVKVDWDFEDCYLSEIEMDIPNVVNLPDMDEDEVADYLSDEYGFCVNSWYEL